MPTDARTLHLALPKGRMHDNVVRLLEDAGVRLTRSSRGYRPGITLPETEVKILKPQNIVTMLAAGTRDCGFAGADWVTELAPEIAEAGEADGGGELVEVLDTGLDPVRIVAAAPRETLVDGRLPTDRHLLVASETRRVTEAWIRERGLDASFVRTYGATEVFPPEDADCIVDVTQTGATLEANGLVIIDELMRSSTRFYASAAAMRDTAKRERIEDLRTLMVSVLEARSRVLMEMNVDPERLDALIEILPCMRQPTVGQLHAGRGYAVKVVVPRSDLPRLIPRIKQTGGTDLVITPVQQVVP